MKIAKTMTAVALSLFLGAGVTLAQQQAPAPAPPPTNPPAATSTTSSAPRATAATGEENVKYSPKTVYDFEDDNVEGDLQRPDGELIDSVRKVKHSSLIEIREHFIPEMLKSLEDL